MVQRAPERPKPPRWALPVDVMADLKIVEPPADFVGRAKGAVREYTVRKFVEYVKSGVHGSLSLLVVGATRTGRPKPSAGRYIKILALV